MQALSEPGSLSWAYDFVLCLIFRVLERTVLSFKRFDIDGAVFVQGSSAACLAVLCSCATHGARKEGRQFVFRVLHARPPPHHNALLVCLHAMVVRNSGALSYFGEDPELTPQEFFTTLHSFIKVRQGCRFFGGGFGLDHVCCVESMARRCDGLVLVGVARAI